ncbi:hypothetical protein AKJ16_DCAP09414 [Drosera capensis]
MDYIFSVTRFWTKVGASWYQLSLGLVKFAILYTFMTESPCSECFDDGGSEAEWMEARGCKLVVKQAMLSTAYLNLLADFVGFVLNDKHPLAWSAS